MRLPFRTAAFCAGMALTTATAAWSQAGRPDPGPGPYGPPPEMQAMREARQRQHAQDLRIILRLRPDQEAALTAFLGSHDRPPGAPERSGPPPEALTTPQRLDEMSRRAAEHAASEQRHSEALRAFYAALSPDQRQVFDALIRIEGPRREDGGPWGGPWGGMGGGRRPGPPGFWGPPPG